MKMPPEEVSELNAVRRQNDPRTAHINAYWWTAHQGHCFDPRCQVQHDFLVSVAIAHPPRGEYPQVRLMVEKDEASYLAIPLTKAALAELITDAQACLGELP